MRRPNNRKRMGFQAHPHASQIAALDFEAASQAFRRALALSAQARGDAAVDATADEEWRTANALLSIPASSRRQIAEKLAVFNHAFRSGPLLSDPAAQRHVASTGKEADKALLAIYLDLTSEDHAARIAWEAARHDFETAQAAHDAVTAREDADGIELEEESADTHRAASDALEHLVNTRAPDAAAMAFKMRWIIERAYAEWRGDHAENPQTIARMLAGTWAETGAAALYQDAKALSGEPSAVINTPPDDFDAEAWLDTTAAAFGVSWTVTDESRRDLSIVAQGDRAAEAQAAFDGLPGFQAYQAFDALKERLREPVEPTPKRSPASLLSMRDVFLSGLGVSYIGQQDKVRALVEAALAEVFDAERWLLETEAETGGRIILAADDWGLCFANGEDGRGFAEITAAYQALSDEQKALVCGAASAREVGQ